MDKPETKYVAKEFLDPAELAAQEAAAKAEAEKDPEIPPPNR